MPTVSARKVEILTDAPLVPRVVAALGKAGFKGHNVLPVLSGSGPHQSWSEERLTGAETKQLVVAIASAERTEALVELLAPLLDSHGLLLAISDVQVVRGERF